LSDLSAIKTLSKMTVSGRVLHISPTCYTDWKYIGPVTVTLGLKQYSTQLDQQRVQRFD